MSEELVIDPQVDKSIIYPEEFLKGWLGIITGPMGNGKSFSIYKNLLWLEKNNIPYQTFHSSINTRDEGVIRARNGYSFPATKLANPQKIFDYLKKDTKVIVVDEGQFLDNTIREVMKEILIERSGLIAGLNLDSEKQDFNSIPYFMSIADKVYEASEDCRICQKEPAIYTKFLGEKKKGQIQVGGDELYTAVCSACYDK